MANVAIMIWVLVLVQLIFMEVNQVVLVERFVIRMILLILTGLPKFQEPVSASTDSSPVTIIPYRNNVRMALPAKGFHTQMVPLHSLFVLVIVPII